MVESKFINLKDAAKMDFNVVIACAIKKDKDSFARFLRILNGNLIALFNTQTEKKSNKKVRDIKRK